MPALGPDIDLLQLAHELSRVLEREPRLAQLLRLRLGRELPRRSDAARADLERLIAEQLSVAEREQWTSELLAAACVANPESVTLRRLAGANGLAASPPPNLGFEALITEENGFHDFTTWSRGLLEIEGRICRVELGERPLGTGFLVGEELVMTNWHVVRTVIATPDTRSHVRLRFDYKRLPSGVTAHSGTVFSLADEWLLDYSASPPIAGSDAKDAPAPQLDQLDYAILRVRPDRDGAPVGRSRVGGASARAACQRGWVRAPLEAHTFEPGQGLMIVQHPSGDPLQLAFEADAILRVNENGTRVRYRTNTLGGSSGSPCFNTRMELVALHHGGDPAHPGYAQFNQGIPIARICELLRARGHGDVLSAGSAATQGDSDSSASTGLAAVGVASAADISDRAAASQPSRQRRPDPARRRGPTGWYSEPDEPYRAYLVGRGGFVDRAPYRASLRAMHDDYGEKVLCITGEPQSGKSFSWFLLKHFADKSDAEAIKIDMRRWPGGPTPADVVAYIAPTLDIDIDIDIGSGPAVGSGAVAGGNPAVASGYDRHAQATRQRMQLVRWLIGKLNTRARRCWLFFDHIDADTVRPETRELLFDLGRAADEGEADLRVVLVGLEQDRLDESLRYVAREDRPLGVTLSDVESYLIELGRHLGVSVALEEARISAQKIYADGTVARMRGLPRMLHRVASALFQEADS